MNDYLRKKVKMLKALQGITYKEIAEYLEIKNSSFYSWIYGNYNLSRAKQSRLNEILNTLEE